MKYTFPEKTSHMSPNLIREVSERGAAIPGFISLAIGNPAPAAIPSEAIKSAIEQLLCGDLMELFEYGPRNGDALFRQLTKKRLVEVKGFPAEGRSIVSLAGSSQGLGLAPLALCDEGEEIYFEDFSFSGAIDAANAAGCHAVSIRTDEYGMIPEDLARAAREGKGRLVYLNPNFHNPTGVTMPLFRRKEIYEVARQYDLLLYEDDPYGDIRFRGEHIPCFAAMDPDQRVVFAGSYSKTVSPGLRVGYLYAPDFLAEKLQSMKSALSGESALLMQKTIAAVLTSIDYERHIQEICQMYGERCRLMEETLRTYSPEGVTYTHPEGGMFLWATLPASIDPKAMFDECFRSRVGAVPSAAFSVDPVHNPGRSLRLNFTYPSMADLVEASKRFGEAACRLMSCHAAAV